MKRRSRQFSLIFFIILFVILNSFLLASKSIGDFEEIVINFIDPEFFKIGEYDFVRIEDTSYMTAVGEPMLPVKPVQVLIEDREIDRVEIVSFVSEDINDSFYIMPVQHAVANFTMPEAEPSKMVYESNNLYPKNVYEITGVSRMRDYPIMNILIFPLQYKPKSQELTFYKSLKIRIYYKSDIQIKAVSQIAKEKRHESELFDNFIQDSVLNPEKLKEIKEKRDKSLSQLSIEREYSTWSDEPVSWGGSPTYCSGLSSSWADDMKYLIITGPGNGVFDPGLNFRVYGELAEWKMKKGVPAKVANFTEITGSVFNCVGQDNAEKVRNFIKDVYDIWGIEYVLLGGGETVVPTRTGYGNVGGSEASIETDLYFADLDGTSNWSSDGNGVWGETTDDVDLAADVFIGRMVYANVGSGDIFISRAINRTLFYEKNPPGCKSRLL